MSKTKIINEYWIKYKDIYGFEVISAKFREKKILSSLDLKGKRILEIGFGFRPIIGAIDGYAHYVGIEPGSSVFNDVQSKYSNVDNITLVNDFLEGWFQGVKEQEFDIVIIPGVLHEVINPSNFLKLAWGLVKKNGTLYINVPNAHSLHREIAVAMNLIDKVDDFTDRNVELGQNNIFSMKGLKSLVDIHCDNKIITMNESFFVKPFTHSQMMSAIEHGVINENILQGLYNVSPSFPESGSEIAMTVRKI